MLDLALLLINRMLTFWVLIGFIGMQIDHGFSSTNLFLHPTHPPPPFYHLIYDDSIYDSTTNMLVFFNFYFCHTRWCILLINFDMILISFGFLVNLYGFNFFNKGLIFYIVSRMDFASCLVAGEYEALSLSLSPLDWINRTYCYCNDCNLISMH